MGLLVSAAFASRSSAGPWRLDEAISLRTLVQAEVDLGAISFVGEFQDSPSFLTDSDGGVSTIVVDAAELLQAYVGVLLTDAATQGSTLDLRFGRQTMDLGGWRLVARNRFRDTIQNYTGPTAQWKGSDKSELFSFFVLPVAVKPSNSAADRDDLLDNAIEFDEGELETWKRDLYTPGFRFLRSPRVGSWDYDIETALQLGSRRASTASWDGRTSSPQGFGSRWIPPRGWTASSPGAPTSWRQTKMLLRARVYGTRQAGPEPSAGIRSRPAPATG